jgi:hypothetical protein
MFSRDRISPSRYEINRALFGCNSNLEIFVPFYNEEIALDLRGSSTLAHGEIVVVVVESGIEKVN